MTKPNENPKFWDKKYKLVSKGNPTNFDCMVCGRKMKVRFNEDRNHANYGDIFLGCKYPECENTQKLTPDMIDEIIRFNADHDHSPADSPVEVVEGGFVQGELLTSLPKDIHVHFNPHIEQLIIKLLTKLIGE